VNPDSAGLFTTVGPSGETVDLNGYMGCITRGEARVLARELLRAELGRGCAAQADKERTAALLGHALRKLGHRMNIASAMGVVDAIEELAP
jgi:hypothetical protein